MKLHILSLIRDRVNAGFVTAQGKKIALIVIASKKLREVRKDLGLDRVNAGSSSKLLSKLFYFRGRFRLNSQLFRLFDCFR